MNKVCCRSDKLLIINNYCQTDNPIINFTNQPDIEPDLGGKKIKKPKTS